jgi:multidrug resistance efflux pump
MAKIDLDPAPQIADLTIPKMRRAPRREWLRPAVLLRLATAVAALAVGGWYLGERLLLVSSLEGVVTAPLVVLRAPIDGRVRLAETIAPAAGVRAGQPLFTVVDDRVDDRSAVDLRARLDSANQAELALVQRIADLQHLKDALLQRSGLHRDANVQRLAALIGEAEASREGARAQLTRSRAELVRIKQLAAHQVQSAAKLEQAEAQTRQDFFEVERLSATIQRAKVELEAANRGVMLGDGYSDVPYSLQRIDEVTMRLSELTAEQDALRRSRQELEAKLTAEAARVDQLRAETVNSPATGLVWSLGVADGARVSRGDVLGEFTDCRQSYVEATLPERGFDAIHPGAPVRVRLARGLDDLPGTVRSLRGAGATPSTLARAATIESVGSGMMTVVVDIDPQAMASQPAGPCQIGRSAKVLF